MPEKRMLGLDGLRGIALLSVLLFHFRFVFQPDGDPVEAALFRAGEWGWMGVSLFFALSGFLITGILLKSATSSNYFSAFYKRRSLRIFPLYFVYLAVVLGVVHNLHPERWPVPDWQYYPLYAANWKANHTAGDPHVAHLWSLCIEEQFYLLWPLVVWFSGRRLPVVCVSLSAASLALRLVLPSFGVGYEAIYRGSFTNMDGLVLGGLLAVSMQDAKIGRLFNRFQRPALVIALITIAAVALRVRGLDTNLGQGFGGSALAAVMVLAVRRAVLNPPRFLLTPWLSKIGLLGYGMYVFHELGNQIVRPHVQNFLAGSGFAIPLKLLYILAMVILTYAAAWASYRFLEGPINELKRYFPYQGVVTRQLNNSALVTHPLNESGVT